MDTPSFSLRVEIGDEWGQGSVRNKASRSQGFQRAALQRGGLRKECAPLTQMQPLLALPQMPDDWGLASGRRWQVDSRLGCVSCLCLQEGTSLTQTLSCACRDGIP